MRLEDQQSLESDTPPSGGPTEESIRQSRNLTIGIVLGLIVFISLLAAAVYLLLQPSTPTEKIRDIFIIFMAFESGILGLALIILIVQLAKLINLLQNEVKPILDSTTETVSTLRGTSIFLSDNLVQPVVKLNSYLAGIRRAVELLNLGRGRRSDS